MQISWQFNARHANSFMITTNDRFNNLYSAIATNHQTLSELQIWANTTSSIFDQFGMHLDNLERSLSQFTNLMAIILHKIAVQIPLISQLERDAHRFHMALDLLHTGVLTTELIPVDIFESVLNNITASLSHQFPMLQLAYTDISSYYTRSRVHVSRDTDIPILYIHVQIPLKSLDSLLRLFKVYVYPMPVSQHHENVTAQSAMNLTTGVSPYFAVTSDSQYYIELCDSDLNGCIGDEFLQCSTPRALTSASRSTCTSSLFFNNSKTAFELCNIMYEPNNVIEPNVIYLEKGNVLVVSQPLDLTLSSSGHSQPPKTVSHNGFAKYQIPCGCVLSGKDLLVTSNLNDCHNSFTNFTTIHFSNVPYMASLLNNFSFQEFSYQSTVPPTKFNLPQINISAQNWSNIVSREGKFQIDYKKASQFSKQHKPIFLKASDQLLQLAGDQNLQSPLFTAASVHGFVNSGIYIITLGLIGWVAFISQRHYALAAFVHASQVANTRASNLPKDQVHISKIEHYMFMVLIPLFIFNLLLLAINAYLVIKSMLKRFGFSSYLQTHPRSNILLDVASPYKHVCLKLVSLPFPPTLVYVNKRRFALEHVQIGMFTGKLTIDWKDLNLKIYQTSDNVSLPSTIVVNRFQAIALRDILQEERSARLLVGNQCYFMEIPIETKSVIFNPSVANVVSSSA